MIDHRVAAFVGILICLSVVAPATAATVPSQASPGDAATRSAAWIGKTAAGFRLSGIDGKMVDVSKSLGKRPVVLVFYRGVW